MFDVMTIGTLTIDLYFQSESLTCNENNTHFELAMGGKYFTDHFHESLGGGATNVAIGLQKQGVRTALKTIIGDNSFKKMITEKLTESGVSFLHCKYIKGHLNISSILLSLTGEKTVINYQSPHQHIFTSEDDYSALLRAKTVYIANIPDVSFFEKIKILKFLKKNDKQVILNLGVVDCRRPMEQISTLLESTDILIINGHEFSDLVKKPCEEINFQSNILEKYLPNFINLILIVTDGSNGSHGYNKDKIFHQQSARPTKIVDSTGAGDGFSAGFIAEYTVSADIKKSMLCGTEYAWKILAKIGAN